MSKIEMKVPNVAESITEVTVAQFLVEDGDYVEMDQPVVELETDKASQEIPAEKAGRVEFVAEEGDDLAVGGLICYIDTSAEAPEASGGDESATSAPAKEEKQAEKPAEKVEAKQEQPKSDSYAAGHASPAASKMIAENNLDAGKISGSGKDGRITKQDVREAIANGNASMKDGYSALVNQSPLFSREESTKKMSRMRRTVAERLVYAKNSTAMLTTFNEVDMGPIMEIRKQWKEKFKEKHGIGLGFMSFFSKACAIALTEYPLVNSSIDGNEILSREYVDISIAVSTPKGLVVPVIRNAESLSLADLEKSVKDLAIKGRDGKLTMDDMTGGTFTISNGGVFGSLMSTPIINPPQTAILGMHKIQQRPMAINGKVEIRPMMYLALSYDHRIIDGKESVGFLVRVKELLEEPQKMLLGEDPVKLLLQM